MLAELEPLYVVDLSCDEEVVPFYERIGFAPYQSMIRRDRSALESRASVVGPDTPK